MNHPPTPGFRTGLAALIGRTNAGKSSLINGLVDSKIAIVSPKPQTTRHAIHGVVHRPLAQVVFVDTPGFFVTGRSRLVDRLHARARAAFEGVDVMIHVADPFRPFGEEDAMVLEVLTHLALPKVLCLNKCDLPARPYTADWQARAEGYGAVVDVSAAARTNLAALVDAIIPLLPEGPPLYGTEDITNANRDFRIAEIVREKIYLLTGEEVPYRTAVQLNYLRERSGPEGTPILHVKADILVAEERYKGMLIGAGGRKVRSIGVAARNDIENLLERKIYLELSVAVDRTLPQ